MHRALVWPSVVLSQKSDLTLLCIHEKLKAVSLLVRQAEQLQMRLKEGKFSPTKGAHVWQKTPSLKSCVGLVTARVSPAAPYWCSRLVPELLFPAFSSKNESWNCGIWHASRSESHGSVPQPAVMRTWSEVCWKWGKLSLLQPAVVKICVGFFGLWTVLINISTGSPSWQAFFFCPGLQSSPSCCCVLLKK